jgi:hypothetical protein
VPADGHGQLMVRLDDAEHVVEGAGAPQIGLADEIGQPDRRDRGVVREVVLQQGVVGPGRVGHLVQQAAPHNASEIVRR